MILDRALTAAASAAAVGALALAAYLWRDSLGHQRAAAELRTTLATERADRATERADLTAQALAATARERATEQRWSTAYGQAATDAAAQLDRARRDADLARTAGNSLRARAAHYASLCAAPAGPQPGPGAPAAPAGPPASHPGLVLADVLGRLDAAGRELAALADARGAAGTACERAHDALTRPPTAPTRQPGPAPPH
jgi:hypothetical protein